MCDTAQSAHLLAAAGPTGAAVDEVRQGRAVAGRFFGIVAVEDEHSAVPWGDLADEFGGELTVVGDDGADEGTAAAGCQTDGILGVGIGDDRGDGSEGLDVVDGIGPGVIGLEDGGRNIGTPVFGGELVRFLTSAGQQVRSAGDDLVDRVEDVGALPVGDDGAQAGGLLARITDALGGELRDDGLADRLGVGLGDEGAADRGALLSGLDGHLGDDAGDEEVELFGAGCGIGTEQGEVQRVRLGEEPGAALGHAVESGEVAGGVRGTGERDRVLFGEMVEERGDVAIDQLDRAVGKQTGLDHVVDDRAGQMGGIGGGLDDDGDAGDKHRTELLEHAPDGEVEGVDLQCESLPGGQDVAADEGAVLRQALDSPVEVDGRVRHLAAGDAGVGEEGADAAFDVDEGVALRGSGGEGDLVVVLRALHEVGSELLEDHSALVEGELLQLGDSGGPSVVGDGGEVDSCRAHRMQELSGAGVADGSGGLGRSGLAPGSGHIGTEDFGHALLSLVKRRLPVHGGR